MKLRIIAGSLKRRKIEFTGTAAQFRPTKDRVRESVADYLHARTDDAFVADMCAGSGAFGFEMASRGARSVHFVEKNLKRCGRIDFYIQHFEIEEQCRIFRMDIRTFLKSCSHTYDIIYFDPPYDNDALAELVPNILPIVAPQGIFIYERRRQRTCIPERVEDFTIEDRTYGDTTVSFFTHTF